MQKDQLQRTIGLWTATSIVVGSVIGSGIFMRPSQMAGELGSPMMLLIVWVVAGLISMFGAMINAEFGAMFPQTGGQYIFLKVMYGEFFSFLFGWGCFAVINTAGVCAIAFVFSQYLGYFFHLPDFSVETANAFAFHVPFIGAISPLDNFGIKSVTILLVLFLTIINYFSVIWGGGLQLFFTILKILTIIFLVGGIFFFGHGTFHNFIQNSPTIHPQGFLMIAAFAAATTGAFMSYDGWNNITFVAGEIKDPQRNIPRSLFYGMLICIICYLLINQALLYVLPIDAIAGSKLVASDAMSTVLGTSGGAVIAAMVVISTFGCVNANLLAQARVTFAMAEEKKFFHWAGTANPKFKTPGNALILHLIWSLFLILSGSFEILGDMFIFVTWIFYACIAFGIFILRKRMPDAERPYKVWGYPIIPIIFILFAVYYIFTTLYSDIINYLDGKTTIINSVFGLALTAIGIPLYFYFTKKKK